MSSTSSLPYRLKSLSDQALIESTKAAVRKERSATIEVLHHFIEVENRRLYADQHSSLFAWAREELHYTEGAAQRRIDSSRLLSRHPQLEQQIDSGQVSLTQLSYARHFFRQEKKYGKPYSPEQEQEVLAALEGKSTRKTLRYLMDRSSAPEKLDPKNGTRPKKNGKTELRLILNEEAMSDLNRIMEIWSHVVPDGDLAEIIARAAKVTLEKIDPMKKAERALQRTENRVKRVAQHLAKVEASQKAQVQSMPVDQRAVKREIKHVAQTDSGRSGKGSEAEAATRSMAPLPAATASATSTAAAAATASVAPTPAATASAGGETPSHPITMSTEIFEEVDPLTGERQLCLPRTWHTRYIPAEVKHAVWIRDGGQCTYVGRDGRRCCSRHQLEFEHIIPFALGGNNSVDNIRLLCRSHNSHMAERVFGRRLMNKRVQLRREAMRAKGSKFSSNTKEG